MVGASGAVLDLLITTAAFDIIHYLLANALGFAIAVTWNFGWNWRLVFGKPSGSLPLQYLSYVAVHSVTFGARVAALAALVELVSVPVLPATIVGIGVASVLNYLATEKIFESGLEQFDVVAALNAVAHRLYSSRLRTWLRATGIYHILYAQYVRVTALIYRDNDLQQEIGDASASIVTEFGAETVSVLHTLEKERDIIERFLGELETDDVVLDVGANLGVYSVLAGDVAERVIAIEPVDATAERCLENVRRNDIDGTVVRSALADRSDTMELALERDEIGTQTAALDGDATATETVNVQPGDALLESTGLPSPDAVKIDVEGAELAVLRGLEETLDDVRVVLVESHNRDAAVRDRLLDAGLSVRELVHDGEQTYLLGVRSSHTTS